MVVDAVQVVPIARNSLSVCFRQKELPTVLGYKPDRPSHSICHIVASTWRMIDGVFAAAPTVALKSAELSLQFLDVQKLKPFAGEHVSAAFPLEVIEACIVPGWMEIPYSPHVTRYFGFLDPSGGRHDAFTLVLARS
jgi:hypothetical protein